MPYQRAKNFSLVKFEMSIFIQLGLNDAVIAVKDLLLVNLYDLSFICVKDRRDNFDSDLIKLLILDLF